MSESAEIRRKFRALLREIFQFESAELNFGIYRIMNHKREAIEQFIGSNLEETIDTAISSSLSADHKMRTESLKDLAEKVKEVFGANALDPDGNLVKGADMPLGKQYAKAHELAANILDKAQLENSAFNHLHAFFSRYYEDGDFISKRRYSARERYAIPYNGEEVHLHWANRDQYYIKTGEHFARYEFKHGDFRVRFALQNADTEQDNRKGEKRFFFPLAKQANCEGSDITIPFDYRPFKTGEKARVGGGNGLQEKILEKAMPSLQKTLPQAEPGALLSHMRRYTRRNTSDYFIHKNLQGFLSRELDFYIKNEVLSLDDLERAGEFAAEGRFHLLRVIRKVGGRIIEFLAQIENFQKRLFEKKKFVIETHWCAAVGQIGDEKLLAEIAACDAQWKEWRALLNVTPAKPKRRDSLRANPTMLVDTRHFDGEFKNKLLAQFEDIDDACDGVLIHSENFQGLNLLSERYRKQVKCIYIDPPYNTDASAILYKNDYKHSSWLSLVENRAAAAKEFMPADGILCCAIDDEEAWRLRHLMQYLFERELGIVPVRSTPAGRKTSEKFSPSHEYALFYGRPDATPGVLKKTQKELDRYPFSDKDGSFAWNNLIRHGSGDKREDVPTMFYPIYVGANESLRVPKMEWDESKREYKILENVKNNETAVWPIRFQDGQKIEKRWHRGWERVMKEPEEYRVRKSAKEGISIDFKIRMDEGAMPKTWWDDGRYSSANHGTKALKNILPGAPFDFPKSIELVKDCILASGANNLSAKILDFFAGSGTTGHAVINLNREDGGQRKFILIEMGDHFDNVLLPRIKKITYAPEWKDGKPRRTATKEEAARSPRLLKYQRLESYEDALENIQFEDMENEQQLMEFPDYLLRYMLQWETRHSPALLDAEKLNAPFDYKLRLRRNGNFEQTTIDLPETFNYLIGLQVKTRRTLKDGPRPYLIYTGQSQGRPTTIIWRTTKDWQPADFERDKAFIANHHLATSTDKIYINDDSLIPRAQSLDPIFKKRLFAATEA